MVFTSVVEKILVAGLVKTWIVLPTWITMHQHPRSPAPASAGRSNASRSDDRREQGFGLNSPAVDARPPTGRGLGIETDPDSSEHVHPPQPSKDVMAKLNQIISVCRTSSTSLLWRHHPFRS